MVWLVLGCGIVLNSLWFVVIWAVCRFWFVLFGCRLVGHLADVGVCVLRLILCAWFGLWFSCLRVRVVRWLFVRFDVANF